jgi:hypothetical protein
MTVVGLMLAIVARVMIYLMQNAVGISEKV